MLNKGNASFLSIIKLPFTYVNVTVKTNIMAYTSEGVVFSDLVIVRITLSLVKIFMKLNIRIILHTLFFFLI